MKFDDSDSARDIGPNPQLLLRHRKIKVLTEF
jgi:hypothetical protein